MQINKLAQINKIAIYIVLALPLFTFSPWMYPADFPKTIIFRSILAIMLFALLWQNIKNNPASPRLSGLLRTNKIFWAMTGLLGAFFLSTIFSVDSYFSLWGSPWRGGGFVTFAFYFAFVVLTFITLQKPARQNVNALGGEDWQKIWDFSIVIGILISFIAIAQYFSLFSKVFMPMESRPASALGNPILLAIYILLLFFITLSFLIRQSLDSNQNKLKKIFYGFAILIYLSTIFISGTRAVWLGIFIGLLYFLLFYPTNHTQGSKMPIRQNFLNLSKIIAILFIVVILGIVSYINLFPSRTEELQDNRTLQMFENRLSIKNALNDERYKGWQVALQAIQDKPILGWGIENFAIGFDKYYDAKLIYSLWWDKAHNIILDIGAQAGVVGIIAYLSLFVILFWQLQKLKHTDSYRLETDSNRYGLISHGLQTTLIGYFIANLFSFDCFGTYLIFFFIVAYTLHLTTQKTNYSLQTTHNKLNKPILVLSFCVLIFFLWQYNILPFYINYQINIADALAKNKYCDLALSKMDNALKHKSFLDSYTRLKYVEITKICQDFYPEKITDYIKKDYELLQEAVKIQPLYTRYWISLGQFASNLKEYDKANKYFNKALELAPGHKEILQYKLDTSIALQNYNELISIFQYLIEKNPNNFQYHASLAYAYKLTGNYELARKEAMIVIELSPESKEITEQFLKSLPN